MSESTRRVGRGFMLDIYIQLDKLRADGQFQTLEESKTGVGVEELDDPTYVFHKKGCKIYDLARIFEEGDHDYHAISDSLALDYNGSTGHLATTTEQMAIFEDSLRTQLVHLPLSDRERLAYASQDFYLDVFQTSENDSTATMIGTPDSRPLLSGEDSDRRWLNDGGFGKLKLLSGIKSISVVSFAYFMNFNTVEGGGFRLTETPDEASPNAEGIDLETLEGIYLIRPVLRWSVTPFSLFNENNLLRMIPDEREIDLNMALVPSSTVPNVINIDAMSRFVAEYVETGAYDILAGYNSGGMVNAVLRISGNLITPPASPDPAKLNRLRAILKTSSKTYYVWWEGLSFPAAFPWQDIVLMSFTHGIVVGRIF